MADPLRLGQARTVKVSELSGLVQVFTSRTGMFFFQAKILLKIQCLLKPI